MPMHQDPLLVHIQIVHLAFPWHVYRQMVTAFKGEIYFGSIPTLSFPHVLICWLNNFVLFRFWKFYSRGGHFDSSSDQTQTGTSQGSVNSAFFFKFELFIASVKIQWEPFRMTIHQDN